MTTTPLTASPYGNLRMQRILLWISAIFAFTGLPAIVFPALAIEKLSWIIGFGQPPNAPMLFYVTGGGAYLYVAVGVLTVVIVRDVVRYRPLVLANGWIYLVGCPGFLWINLTAGLPWWWAALDSVSCLVIGVLLLWACRPRTAA